MKKDIEIPEVNDVYVAVVNEYNKIYKTYDWNAYIINDKDVALEMVLIVSRGYDKNRISTGRSFRIEQRVYCHLF